MSKKNKPFFIVVSQSEFARTVKLHADYASAESEGLQKTKTNGKDSYVLKVVAKIERKVKVKKF